MDWEHLDWGDEFLKRCACPPYSNFKVNLQNLLTARLAIFCKERKKDTLKSVQVCCGILSFALKELKWVKVNFWLVFVCLAVGKSFLDQDQF